MFLTEVDDFKRKNVAGRRFFCCSHHSVVAVERERPLWCWRGTALKVVNAAFMDDDVPQRPFHEAELAASLLVQVSRGGNSSRHGEEVLGPDGSHRHRPAHLWRRHGYDIPLIPNTHPGARLGTPCERLLLPQRRSGHVRGHDGGSTVQFTTIIFKHVEGRRAVGRTQIRRFDSDSRIEEGFDVEVKHQSADE